jgi:hypothetical protein
LLTNNDTAFFVELKPGLDDGKQREKFWVVCMGVPPTVKPPQPSRGEEDYLKHSVQDHASATSNDEIDDDEERHLRTGRLSQSEFASWFGNALVLASLGTLSLFVGLHERTVAMDALSVLFIALAFFVTVWAGYKYFVIGRKTHHWTEWILFVYIVAATVAFVWFASFILM